MSDSFLIGQAPIPKIAHPGRPKGWGSNLRLLNRMKPGDCIWDVPEKKMKSIRSSAIRNKIKVSIRYIPETGFYTLFKL